MATFSGAKYMTERVQYEIGQQMQMYLWKLIEDLKEQIELDYLQIFNLEVLPSGVQVVTHTMEQPRYKAVYYVIELPLQFAFQKKVYVIDSGAYVTMMLAEEY